MTTATALVVPKHGDSSVLTVEKRELPAPGPGEALVAVAAAGVNFIDIYQRSGVYDVATPYVAGMEGAGTVEAVGDGVTDVGVGGRVAWAMTLGSAATYAIVPAERLVPVPDGVDLETAAAGMLQGCTAQFLVTDCYPVREGTVALIHAAAGGVGQLLVQLAKAKGGIVVAAAGGKHKCDIARSRGADHVLDYSQFDSQEALAQAVVEAVGRKVDVAYDGVGKATFDASMASLAPRGYLVLFGAASGPVPPVDPQRLNRAGSLYLTRPSLGNYVSDRDELLARADDVFGLVADGKLDIEIGGRYPLADAKEAYDALEGRRTTGKLLLIP